MRTSGAGRQMSEKARVAAMASYSRMRVQGTSDCSEATAKGSPGDFGPALLHSRLIARIESQALCSGEMTPTPSISTVNDLFFRVAGASNPRAVLWQDDLGRWR